MGAEVNTYSGVPHICAVVLSTAVALNAARNRALFALCLGYSILCVVLCRVLPCCFRIVYCHFLLYKGRQRDKQKRKGTYDRELGAHDAAALDR